MINQVPNLNHYPINTHDERFGVIPFVGGLAVGALASGFGGGGGRPCGPMCGPQFVQPVPYPQPVFIQQPQFQQPQFQQPQQFPSIQGPIIIR